MTYEQFLSNPDIDSHTEWVDGEVTLMPPVADGHSDVGRLLIIVVGFFVDHNRLGIIRYEPFQMKTGPDLPGRSPDILFVANAHLKRLHRQFLDGPADLVIEIVSPESQTRDRVHKFAEYEVGGVREYWLIDPDRRLAEFYVRGRNGKFRRVTIGPDGVYHSKVVSGFWLRVPWLWQESMPSAAEALKELGML